MEVLRLAVLDQQEARAKAYADFEAGYVSYLGGGSDEEYEALCKSVTGRFAAASEEIKKSEAEIMKGGEEKLCGWIRKLQEAEKEKLQLTIALQVERKRAKQMEEMRSQRSESESAPDQMTEEEEEFVAEVQGNKLNWLKEKVGEVVVSINEALDEIRYWDTE